MKISKLNYVDMKYNLDITIDLPRDRVIELFDNPDNMKEWQSGFVSLEPLDGSPGQTGAKSKLLYKMGRRDIEMIETIIKRDLPNEFSASYEAKGVWNSINNIFSEEDENQCKWVLENEFRFTGFMKIIAFLMPGSFKKETWKMMVQFKNFAERVS